MAKYINKETREKLVVLLNTQSAIESIIEKWQDMKEVPFKLRWLRSANSYLRKFILESVTDVSDQKDMKRVINYFKDSKMLIKTEASATFYMQKWEDEYNADEVKVPVRFLDALITETMKAKCVGCTGIDDCKVEAILDSYDVPANSISPNKCKYEAQKEPDA